MLSANRKENVIKDYYLHKKCTWSQLIVNSFEVVKCQLCGNSIIKYEEIQLFQLIFDQFYVKRLIECKYLTKILSTLVLKRHYPSILRHNLYFFIYIQTNHAMQNPPVMILSKHFIWCNLLIFICATKNQAVEVNLNSDDLEEVPSDLWTNTTILLLA